MTGSTTRRHLLLRMRVRRRSPPHLTQANADALFLGDRLMPVFRAFTIARRARSLMRENLALAVIYNALAVPIAMAGSSRL